MGQVIALDDYRREHQERLTDLSPPERPEFSAGDVWGRDYASLEGIVYGLLTARQTLRYYTEYDERLEGLFLEVLDAAYRLEELGTARLAHTIAPLKEYILSALNTDNMKALKTALILLDLIEKSPTYK